MSRKKLFVMAAGLYIFFAVLITCFPLRAVKVVIWPVSRLVRFIFRATETEIRTYLISYNRLNRWHWNKCLTLCLVAWVMLPSTAKPVINIGSRKTSSGWQFHAWLPAWEWPGPLNEYQVLKTLEF